MELEIFKKDGKPSGSKVTLPEKVFGAQPSQGSVYLAVKCLQANARQGTHNTKTRAMVSGGGKKPWKQKGRGVARAGTIRSPLWVGGGRVFGPHPRDYGLKLPKKVKALARISVYSDKARNEQVMVVENFKLDQPKTKEMFGILKSLGLEKTKTLMLVPEYDAILLKASRNLPMLNIKVAATESTYDLLNCERLLIQEAAIAKISGVPQ
ncbi:MAG TPA: 50S ribosomal protein L4 [bacterium]